ncbi:MAG: MBOAT family protein [Bacteroidales bacterium]|nr:MBOAT family protein [Bacteroidales bacterium]
MLFTSYELFFTIILFVLLFVFCRWMIKRSWLDNLLLVGGNILILTHIVSWKSLFLLSLLALLAYGAGLLLQKRKSGWVLAMALSLLILLFSVRNYSLVQSWLGSWWTDILGKHFLSVEKIGLSYILFRLVHWLVESYKGTLRSRDFLTFLNYLFFFPTFMAGPIDTFNNFHYWLTTTRVRFNRRMLMAGVGRIFIGAVKALLIVPLIKPYAIDYEVLLPNLGPWGAVCSAALLYSLYIYIDFSGYCDMAIGMAYMMGVRTPENFDNPYFSTNISEFWKRWHITFSTFLRIYVFKPVISLLNRLPIARYRMVVSVTAYLVTFLVCGLWHGSTVNFVIWGLWHGVGLSVYKLFTYGKPVKGMTKLRKVSGIVGTFLFVTVGWVFFNYPLDKLWIMFKLLFG